MAGQLWNLGSALGREYHAKVCFNEEEYTIMVSLQGDAENPMKHYFPNIDFDASIKVLSREGYTDGHDRLCAVFKKGIFTKGFLDIVGRSDMPPRIYHLKKSLSTLCGKGSLKIFSDSSLPTEYKIAVSSLVY